MNNNLTIVYITANREDEVFEQKIRDKLLEVAGDHPIVSVSQKPINLGHNICVGEVGASYRNANIQIHIGASHAKTEYVAIAEADQLYPPGYFDFKPENDIYMYDGLWVLRHWKKGLFYQKEYGAWTVIVRKSFLIQGLESITLGGNLEWGGGKVRDVFRKTHTSWEWFNVGAPIITIKTPRNLNTFTGTIPGVEPVAELPHWGSATDLSNYLDLRSYYQEWLRSKRTTA